MSTGTLKWFNALKGYGFVQADDGGPDAILHRTALPEDGPLYTDLATGLRLTYQTKETPRGLRAVNIRWEQHR
jgi:CspA family cold shock protein